MKKVLVTGANGFLAQHLCLFLASKNFDVIAVSRGECRMPRKENFQYYSLDLTDEAAVHEILHATNPDIIIHAAAMSKPDECDNNKDECLKQNVEVTKYLLQKTAHNQPHFIYISTDFVFGENGPHSEEDETAPLNFYGESKLLAEKLVLENRLNNSIVRPVFIYGEIWEGLRPTFLHWVKNNLENGKKIKVVSDQQRTPTFVLDICKGIETLAQQEKQGIYHLAGKDILSPYQMAVATAKILRLDENLIEEVTSATFPEPVKRAKKSGLKIDKAMKELNYQPVSFEEGIMRTFNL
jgi:dTDP-4-dehydrorhamnose reductase